MGRADWRSPLVKSLTCRKAKKDLHSQSLANNEKGFKDIQHPLKAAIYDVA